MVQQGTPTRDTIKYIGEQSTTTRRRTSSQYACQRNSMFVVTDGFANDCTRRATCRRDNAATYGAAAPYADDDRRLAGRPWRCAYYTNRLRTDLAAGKVPPGDPARTNPDLNPDLHINTYGITLGARGTLFPTALDPFAVDVFASPPTWPTPVNRRSDDDRRPVARHHQRPRQDVPGQRRRRRLRRRIQSAFNDILNQNGAQGGIAVSAVNLDRGDSQGLPGLYNPARLDRRPDRQRHRHSHRPGGHDAGQPDLVGHQAAGARDWTTRIIFTSSGSAAWPSTRPTSAPR